MKKLSKDWHACLVDGCGSLVQARGLCNAHYLRWRRGAKHLPATHLFGEASDELLFKERVEHRGDCWIWHGACDALGRMSFPMNGIRIDALRASLKLFGSIPYGHLVLGCLVATGCVNPAHLRTVPLVRSTDYGVLDAMTPDRVEDFWSQVNILGENDCWEWSGSRYPAGGYGRFRVWVSGDRFDGRRRAHRISLCLATGIDYDIALDVLHACDNPPCVNPRHLRWGSAEENVLDARDRGRLGAAA